METENMPEIARLPLASYNNVWEFIQTLEYTDSEGIIFLEQQLYNLLQKLPEDINLLILLMHEQMMNNRGQRARSIAYKIWDLGGKIDIKLERMYIDDLMNLGLMDMAGAALMPYLSDLEKNISFYDDLLLKYAVMTGNMSLLERTLAYLPQTAENKILSDWIDLNNEAKATNHISVILSRLTDNVRDSMLGCRYKLFSDREFPEVEFIFYVDDTIKNYQSERQKMHVQISSYCTVHKIQDLINLSVAIVPIQRRVRQELWLEKR